MRLRTLSRLQQVEFRAAALPRPQEPDVDFGLLMRGCPELRPFMLCLAERAAAMYRGADIRFWPVEVEALQPLFGVFLRRLDEVYPGAKVNFEPPFPVRAPDGTWRCRG